MGCRLWVMAYGLKIMGYRLRIMDYRLGSVVNALVIEYQD